MRSEMIYAIENEFLKVEVEDTGAQLKSIFCKETSVEVLWQGDEKYWKGRAYNLFPVVGRLFDGKYRFKDKIYELSRHGFARTKKFYLCDKSPFAMTFVISADDETFKCYPFKFIFKVKFSLCGKSLKIDYIAENVGEEEMYFGLGAHPGFNVPFEGGKFEDYEIVFNAPCTPKKVLFTENYLISDKTENFELQSDNSFGLAHDLFDNDAIVLKDCARSVTLKRKGESGGITVEFPDMPFVGFWHAPKTDAPYVCIEPWANLPSKDGAVEDITEKENIGIVQPHGKCENQIVISFDL